MRDDAVLGRALPLDRGLGPYGVPVLTVPAARNLFMTKITLPSLNARTFWNAFQSFLSSNLLDIMTV